MHYRSMKDSPKIAFFGVGAIGGSVAAWLAEAYDNVHVFDRPEILDTIQKKGITAYLQNGAGSAAAVPVKVIGSIEELSRFDIIVIGVKNYSLEASAKEIHEITGDRPLIIAMQNGAENQKILPLYFSHVVYCVIGYNAWMDGPGVIGYQKKGPLIFGTMGNRDPEELKAAAEIFNLGVETVVVNRLQDAVHSKIIINLSNSLTTLIGHNLKPLGDEALFQKILTNMLLEGVRTVQAAGYGQCKIGGMPSWGLVRAGAMLPRFLTRKIFLKNTRKMVISSMAQDIIQRGGHESELESINGYLLSLAEKHGVNVPYNRGVYGLCRKEFAKEKFEPLDVKAVWQEVEKLLGSQ